MNVHLLGAGDPEALPRGRRHLSREAVLESQRGRMLLGIAHAVAEKGYAEATVADVLRMARVSRATFYEHFANKEDCFAAAYETAADVVASEVAATASREQDLKAALSAGMRAYCSALASDPAVARALMLESFAAGPAVRARRQAAFAAWAQVLEAIARRPTGAPGKRVPPLAGAATVGAITHLLAVALEQKQDLTELSDVLADTAHRLLVADCDVS